MSLSICNEAESDPFHICSMTAYASGECWWQGFQLIIELKGVNHRFLDLSFKLPDITRSLEPQLRQKMSQTLRRGRVEFLLTIRKSFKEQASLSINLGLVKSISEAIQQIEHATRFHLAATSPLDLLQWPGVIEEDQMDREALDLQISHLLDRVLEDFRHTRKREGSEIARIIDERCNDILKEASLARDRLGSLVGHYREKFIRRIQEIEITVDEIRLEQELAYLLQKSDIAEELDRLEVHSREIKNIIRNKPPAGRRLDFLTQELHREANTLGSKSQDLDTTRTSLEIKLLTEQIKEQVQNIE